MSDVGLFDILPETETVSVRGKTYVVYGLFLTDIKALCSRFPELRKMVDEDSFETAALIKLGDNAINTIIALGTQPPRSENRRLLAEALGLAAPPDLEALADALGNLSLGAKAKFLTAIVKATIGEAGFGPFEDLLKTFGMGDFLTEIKAAFRNVLAQVQKIKVEAPVNGSQPASSSSLATDSPPNSSLN